MNILIEILIQYILNPEPFLFPFPLVLLSLPSPLSSTPRLSHCFLSFLFSVLFFQCPFPFIYLCNLIRFDVGNGRNRSIFISQLLLTWKSNHFSKVIFKVHRKCSPRPLFPEWQDHTWGHLLTPALIELSNKSTFFIPHYLATHDGLS